MSGTSLGARFLSHRPSIDAASRRLAFAVIALALTLASSAASAQDAPATVTADECRDVVARLGRSLDERYVFPDKGAACRAMLDELLASGGLEGISAPDEFARVLTDKLQDLTHDKHLRVRFRPPGAGRTEGPRENPALARARQLMQARAQNYAFVKTEILEGNIGYLDLRGFAPPFPAARETAAAAMNFLANCDAVIFDLRRNGGGSPGMIRFVTSWLFEKPTHLNSLYWREGDRTEEFWTQAEIPGRRLADVPAFVLTSNFTFSGGEEFTYNLQCLKRATIIGETTGGGAHPVMGIGVGEGFVIRVPFARSINPITGTNWEGVGVEPDAACQADRALDMAHMMALDRLSQTAPDEQKTRLAWAADFLRSRITPIRIDDEKLRRFAGSFGPRRITHHDGGLYYSRDGAPERRLNAISDNMFMIEGVEFFKVRFETDKAGRVERLVGLYDDGHSDVSVRD